MTLKEQYIAHDTAIQALVDSRKMTKAVFKQRSSVERRRNAASPMGSEWFRNSLFPLCGQPIVGMTAVELYHFSKSWIW